ncbi:cysteine desulfurase-like protein [soil metagenome]
MMPDSAVLSRLRNDFPALQRTIGGRPPAFFDGPAGSQVPRQVIDAVAGYMANQNANTGGAFRTSLETEEMLERARQRVAAFLGAQDAAEVVFGGNMTSLTFALSRSMRRQWSSGDEVIVTDLDHQANVAPWRMAAEEAGARVRVVPFHRETCTLELDSLERMLTSRTRLVAIGYASNAVGTITDVSRVCGMAREVGALSFVDAVHFAPHGLLDVAAIGCDFLACSAYKFFGPHTGILWGRREHLTELHPYKVPPATDQAPGRWETGTLNFEGIAGTGAAVDWIASLGASGGGEPLREKVAGGMRQIEELEAPLLQRLLSGLRAMDGVRVHGPPQHHPRTPTVAFTHEMIAADLIAKGLSDEGVFVWSGDFYAPTVIDRLGLRARGGVVRVGLAPYNTAEEMDRLLTAVDRITRT